MKAKNEIKECVVLFATYKHEENSLCTKETDSITGYALSWLHLTNNARENRNIFLRIANNSGNGIRVVINPKYVNDVKEYLEGIAFSVWDEETRKLVEVDFDWERDDDFDQAIFTFADGLEDID